MAIINTLDFASRMSVGSIRVLLYFAQYRG